MEVERQQSVIGNNGPQECDKNIISKQYPKNSLSFDRLIQELHDAFSQDSVNVDHVQNLMQAYRSDPKEWKKYAKFDRYR